jgi:hypothetical protein
MREVAACFVASWLGQPGQLIKVLIKATKINYSGNLEEGEDWTKTELPLKEILLRIDNVYQKNGKLKFVAGVVVFERIYFGNKNPTVLIPFCGRYLETVTKGWSAYKIKSAIDSFVKESGEVLWLNQFPIEESFLDQSQCSQRGGIRYSLDLRCVLVESSNAAQKLLLQGCESGLKTNEK